MSLSAFTANSGQTEGKIFCFYHCCTYLYVVHNEREERQQEKRKKKKEIKEDNVKVTGRKSEMREEDPAQA